eukprot:2894559-Amphidinium_carterae.1
MTEKTLQWLRLLESGSSTLGVRMTWYRPRTQLRTRRKDYRSPCSCRQQTELWKPASVPQKG